MNQISEKEFRDAVIATKKDIRLVATAKNDRINTPESLYREFIKLTPERQREIVIAISTDYFVGAQWKIAFPLNNVSASVLPDAMTVAGKALFYTREEVCVREAIRAVRQYQDSPYCKQIAEILGEAADFTGVQLSAVARILTSPPLYGMVKSMDPAAPHSEKIVRALGKMAMYTRNLKTTLDVGRFLYARRYASNFADYTFVLENAVFMKRDRRSVTEILAGFGAGAIDVVLQKKAGNREVLSAIRDIAWKTCDANAISSYLRSI